MSETRWAVLRDGQILYGPGPLPYYWTDPATGDPHEMRALDDAARAALGWQAVEIRGARSVIADVRIALAPTVTIEGGQVVETKAYAFAPSARATLGDLIDDWAERRRAVLAQSRPLQTMVYQEKHAEAVRLQTDLTPVDEDYPFLAASLGIEGATIQEVAGVVLATRELWVGAASAIERDRLMTRKLVAEAASDDEALAIFEGTVT